VTLDEIEALYRQAYRVLRMFEAASQKKPAMEPARLFMLNDLAVLAKTRAADAMKALTPDALIGLVERFDADRRVESAKAGLIGVQPRQMVTN
jgi:hypothetical protein